MQRGAAEPADRPGRARPYAKRLKALPVEPGCPRSWPAAIAALPSAYAALTIVQTAARQAGSTSEGRQVHFALGQRLGLDRLLARIIELPRDDRWQTMARAALRDDLHAVHAQLTAEVLATTGAATDRAKELVAGWEKANAAVPDSIKTLRSITASRSRTWPGPRSGCGSPGPAAAAELMLATGCPADVHLVLAVLRRSPRSSRRVRAVAARGRHGGMRIDLHTHSSVSDGTDSPAELVATPRGPGWTWWR